MWKITSEYCDLRKCKYTAYNKEPIVCYFHQWITESIQEPVYEYGDLKGYTWVTYARAIIEFEDGSIALVYPTEIQFLTGEEDVCTTDEGTI